MIVNVFGSTLQLCYVIVFILYSVKKSTILQQFAGAMSFVTIVYLYSIFESDRTLAAQRIGFLSCSLTIMFFASHLTMLVSLKIHTYDNRRSFRQIYFYVFPCFFRLHLCFPYSYLTRILTAFVIQLHSLVTSFDK